MKYINYTTIMNQVNNLIHDFNQYLSPQKAIQFIDENIYFDIENKGWYDINLGETEFYGVYILVGLEDINNTTVIYIGKASLSKISNRLSSHLRQSKKEGSNGFNFYKRPYTLQRIYTINLDNMPFMASALEEYLITNIHDIQLLNEVGLK